MPVNSKHAGAIRSFFLFGEPILQVKMNTRPGATNTQRHGLRCCLKTTAIETRTCFARKALTQRNTVRVETLFRRQIYIVDLEGGGWGPMFLK